jgi:hypothetical protein
MYIEYTLNFQAILMRPLDLPKHSHWLHEAGNIQIKPIFFIWKKQCRHGGIGLQHRSVRNCFVENELKIFPEALSGRRLPG